MDMDLEALWINASRIDTDGIRSLIREIDRLRSYGRRAGGASHMSFPARDLRNEVHYRPPAEVYDISNLQMPLVAQAD